jgi:selenide,water dikinase
LQKIPIPEDPAVLVGYGGADDAGVYRLSDDTALVLTVDYFTPIVDDAFDYGRVAAANSLSDVYAMGGKPLAALNIAGFPEGTLPPEVLGEILRGGADTAARAGVAIVGGHTVSDAEIKYGLAVVGVVHPDRIVTNAAARPGDVLILTKPIGTGVLSTQLKNQKLDETGTRRIVEVMVTLNDKASARMIEHGVVSCTDVTGYGLVGHAYEMAEASGVTIEIDAGAVPLIEGAVEALRDGHIPGGANKNRTFLTEYIQTSRDDERFRLLFDPQTAGGLLIAVSEASADALLAALRSDYPDAAVVGCCSERGTAELVVR